jgi:hypothetical protein
MNTSAISTAGTRQADQAHLLEIYLRDHEAASVGGLQLFRRCAKANSGTPYSGDLQRLANEIRADRDALRNICQKFGVTYSKVGRALALTGATLGRLKTNGRALSYSPLSRVIELEAMTAGVISKLRLWESLLLLARVDPRLDQAELTRHAADAEEQLTTLRRLHDMAAEEAFVRVADPGEVTAQSSSPSVERK